LPVETNQLQSKNPPIDWDNVEFEIGDSDNLLIPTDVMNEIILDECTLLSSNTNIVEKHTEYSSGKMYFNISYILIFE